MRQYVVQTPNVGDRVIVRRQLGDAQGYLTDVIGHVLSVEPLVVRPQSVGGLESSAEAVAIDEDSVVALRVLPARRVRNSDIRAVEVATAKAFPGLEHVWCGGWLLGMELRSGVTPQPPWAILRVSNRYPWKRSLIFMRAIR